MEKEKGKIMKMSRYSYGLVIPKDFIKKLRWKEKQKISIKLKSKNIIVSDWKER